MICPLDNFHIKSQNEFSIDIPFANFQSTNSCRLILAMPLLTKVQNLQENKEVLEKRLTIDENNLVRFTLS